MAQTRQTPSSTKSSKSAPAAKASAKESKDKHEKSTPAAAKPADKKADVKPAAKAAPAPKPAAKEPVRESKEAPAPKAAAKEAPKATREDAPPPPKPPTKIAREPEEAPRPSTPGMAKDQLEHFRGLLIEKRDDIIKKAKQTLDEDMTLDANDLPDEMDLASSEYLQSFTFRLRGREKSFLDKINKALERIDGGNFGVCEECGEEISVKRLEARPETTLCIRCKEDQERAEKDYG
jgi:DnaK suppressor protein